MNSDAPNLVAARADQSPGAPEGLGRYVPLVIWVMVSVSLLMIALKVVSYGFLPGGDGRRHIGKAFTDRHYREIVVMNSAYTMDHSPGWEWLLRFVRKQTDWNTEQITSFALITTMVCLFFSPLPWLRRPEAWIAALLAEMVAIPELMTRFTQARPYLLTEGILIAVLFAWTKAERTRPSAWRIGLTFLGMAVSAWMHGAWYLWVLPLAAFFLAGWWREGLWLTGCWVGGALSGALLTGRPVEFLGQAVMLAVTISKEHAPQWMLVGELAPSYGEFSTVALVAIVFLWRQRTAKAQPALFGQPLFWLMLICWVLGFKADRFWADWGVPAVLVWMTLQFQDAMTDFWEAAAPKRLLLCGLLTMPLVLHATNDLDRRYTGNLDTVFLDGKDPNLQGWVPDGDGIFYSAHFNFFYDTFYKNPEAPWHYILGFEPAWMPPEDLKIYRYILYNHWAPQAYEPWVKKMKPADRLVLYSGGMPDLAPLEWHNVGGGMWLGRLPRQPVRQP